MVCVRQEKTRGVLSAVNSILSTGGYPVVSDLASVNPGEVTAVVDAQVQYTLLVRLFRMPLRSIPALVCLRFWWPTCLIL
jgi:hypothetical protein